jgi:hypothetical protein
MKLDAETDAALDVFIKTSTWDGKHSLDMGRFYKFVSLYQTDHGFGIDEMGLQDELKARARANGHPVGEYQEMLIRKLASTASDILTFLSVTGR